jgi:adenosylcobinamide kinase/adenosylcobinamide-phosphate guanylyltransferase
MSIHLILGGARSGKSRHAEQLALASGLPVKVLVTAHAGDAEMAERIRQHQQQRPRHWQVQETPLALAATLQAHAAPGHLLLVDCLTLWLSNLLLDGQQGDLTEGPIALSQQFQQQRQVLLDALPQLPGNIILISNEVGMGIVPMGALTRCFADEAGRLNQAVAAISQQVTLVAAGLPLKLKG